MSGDPRANHLMAALALRSAMERVMEAYKLVQVTTDDALALTPDALGDPPALPSVVRWLEERNTTAGLDATEAWKMKQKVFIYGEML